MAGDHQALHRVAQQDRTTLRQMRAIDPTQHLMDLVVVLHCIVDFVRCPTRKTTGRLISPTNDTQMALMRWQRTTATFGRRSSLFTSRLTDGLEEEEGEEQTAKT